MIAADQELSKRDLGPHRKRVELRAGIAGVDRTYLPGDVTVQVVEHEADVGIDVPVQARRIDRLPPPGDTVCGGELIVEINRADTAGDLPRTPPPPVKQNGLRGTMPPQAARAELYV